MNDGVNGSASPREQIAPVHVVVGDREENEAEEAVEHRAEEGKEISHAWNDFAEDKGQHPDKYHDKDWLQVST